MGFRIPKITNTYFVALIATVGGMLFGFDISSMSAIIGTSQYLSYFDNPHGIIQGAIGAALAAGSVVGAIMAGPVSNKWGRRDSIFFACLWWLVGTIVQVTCKGYGQLIAGRILNGVCVGITSSQVPVYLAEIAKHDKRGSIIVIQQIAIEVGILVMYFIGYACKFIDGDNSFRTAWAIQLVPAVLLMMGLPFLPRSPRWLAKVDRTDEAIKTLADIQAHGDQDDAMVIAEWNEIMTAIRAEREGITGWRAFTANGMWKRTMAGMSVQAWQQLSGANVMTYYIVYIFSMAGLSGNTNLTSSGIQYALFLVVSSIIFFYIDKTGRRPLLVWGAFGMAICHFIIGGLLSGGTPVPGGVDGNANVTISVSGSPAHALIAFCYLTIIVYGFTLAPVAWVYAAEVWSLETRATGMALASIANWAFNFALGLFIPPALRNITWKIFIVFGCLCMGAAAQAWFTYPETCGKTLEEIELMFVHGAPMPWTTKPGQSRIDAEIEKVKEKKATGAELFEVSPQDGLPGSEEKGTAGVSQHVDIVEK